MIKKPLLLCILDGWGLSDVTDHNAVALAHTPNFDYLWHTWPKTQLKADSEAVGLPDGQFGNSEVGHINIGAGRTVMQELPRINKAVRENTIASEAAIKNLIATQKQNGGAVHVMGLVSSGGVHAHRDHIAALVNILDQNGIKTKIHVFTDGRDMPPSSAMEELEHFMAAIGNCKHATIATVSGRYYAMDRDNRWDRVEKAWSAIVRGTGDKHTSAVDVIRHNYDNSITDEFIIPAVIGDYAGLDKDDALLMVNFRTDRAREILRALLIPTFDGFDRGAYTAPSLAVGMVDYADDINPFMQSVFAPQNLSELFGEVISRNGLKQLRMAETEKYPHVTFFFNNQIETPYEGEDRIVVPSPKVATYDLQPEMSSVELTAKTVEAIKALNHDVIILNFANPDMVGHSGILEAAIKAVEAVDFGLGQIIKALEEVNGAAIIIADHGNAEQMIDPVTREPHTAHTTNPVPCILFNAAAEMKLRDGGKLADVAPTMLQLLHIDQPAAMTGESLIVTD
ncbi:MAG TPA: 2,3-bisphosphoglycerate-independent phosphoglycerate mutase [Alphaproteobacteria bacterium]